MLHGEDNIWPKTGTPTVMFIIRDQLPERGAKRLDSPGCVWGWTGNVMPLRQQECELGTWVSGEGLEGKSDWRWFTVVSEQAQATLFLNLFSLPFISRKFCYAVKHNNQINNTNSDNTSLSECFLCARHLVERFPWILSVSRCNSPCRWVFLSPLCSGGHWDVSYLFVSSASLSQVSRETQT